MRPILEFKLNNSNQYEAISIIPIENSKFYRVKLKNRTTEPTLAVTYSPKYDNLEFTLERAKEKINFLRKFLKIDEEPLVKTQEGVVLPPKRKRRTKAEMEAARRELENVERKKSRTNSIVPKKLSGRTPKTKRNR
jgi:hypothetical protein